MALGLATSIALFLCLAVLIPETAGKPSLHGQRPHSLHLASPHDKELPDGCQVDYERGPRREDFPAAMIFGSATAAYQVEGMTKGGGRGPSIWDTYAAIPGNVKDGSIPDVACDQYHLYEEDVALMKALGMQAYRFSISWSRVLPDGTGRVNPDGIAYYNRLIDALVAAGIEPAVTLYHWDLPQALYDATYFWWLDPRIKEFFAEYADLCFRAFGDRVKQWITFNEPADTATTGYSTGLAAPGRCSTRKGCRPGNSSTDAYTVAHNIIRSHAAAVALYRAVYQPSQRGEIGITLNLVYHYPATAAPLDVAAAEWGIEFLFGWFFDPIWGGDYPPIMREHVGGRLPAFTPGERDQLLSNRPDFVGLNFYTAGFARYQGPPPGGEESPLTDAWVGVSSLSKDGWPIGPATVSSWLWVVPQAIREALLWISRRYDRIPIMVTENGVADAGDKPLAENLCDVPRAMFYQDYLRYVAAAIRDGADVRAYFAWSLLDNWEWTRGYTERFGLVFVNFTDPQLRRRPKASALWLADFLHGGPWGTGASAA